MTKTGLSFSVNNFVELEVCDRSTALHSLQVLGVLYIIDKQSGSYLATNKGTNKAVLCFLTYVEAKLFN